MEPRVLIVAPFPPPYGGIANYAQNLVSGLRGHGVHVHCYDSSRYDRLRLSPVGDDRGYWRALDPRNALFLLAVLFEWVPFSVAILSSRANVVHVHTASSWAWWRSAVYIAIGRLFRCKTILHLHNAIDSFYEKESGSATRWLIRASMGLPHLLIALSDGICAFLKGITDNSITVIYNGVETARFENEKHYARPHRLLFAGAVGRQKGVADLLAAVSRSGLDAEQLIVTVVGRGSIGSMRNLADELGLDHQVTFTGPVPDEVKLDLFRTHHIFALPSYGEGQPISILEGLAAGMAILSTTVGSIPQIITHGENGFLVDPGDIDAMAAAIRALAQPDVLRTMGQANRRLARERYDFSRVLKDVMGAYAQVATDASQHSWTSAG